MAQAGILGFKNGTWNPRAGFRGKRCTKTGQNDPPTGLPADSTADWPGRGADRTIAGIFRRATQALSNDKSSHTAIIYCL
jgi:hypothetical protein